MSIKAGDWVAVIGPTSCCKNPLAVGRVFQITEVDAGSLTKCALCNDIYMCGPAAMQPNGYWIAFSRLKKIDPPSTGELKGVPLRLKEPA